MSKNYFGLLDSRNSKYQGLLKEDCFNGIGILIDNQLTTVLSCWKKQTLNGASVIIFKDLQTFFGEIQENIPKGVVCVQLNQKQKFLIKFQKSRNNASQILTLALILQNQEITHFQRDSQKDQYKAIQTFYAKNQDEQLKILTKIFKMPIVQDQIDLKQYLRKKIVEPLNLFELSGGTQLFFGFKNTASLGFKIQNNTPTSIGYFNLFPRNLLFGRKVHRNSVFPQKAKIQQGNFQEPIQTFSFLRQNGPLTECIKYTEEYFKKSTTFRNQFTQLQNVNKIFKQVKELQEKVKIETSKIHGQALLQQNYVSSHDIDNQVVAKQYTLQQVKDEIYKAAAKKQKTHRTTLKSPIRESIKTSFENNYNDSDNSKRTYRGQYNRTDEFRLSSTINDRRGGYLIEKQLDKEMQRRISEHNNLNKIDLIKNVNQIITAEKQHETALIKLLISDKQILLSHQKQLRNQNTENLSSTSRKYHKYEFKYQQNQYENRYEPKINPFTIEPKNSSTSQTDKYGNQTLQAKLKRKRKYLEEEQNPRQTSFIRSKSPYEIFKYDIQRENQAIQLNPFVHGSQDSHNKTYGNLTKYKQRLRQSTPSKQNSNKRADRFQYLKQNQEDQDNNQIRDTQKLMNQLKLFDLQNENQEASLLRSYTQNQQRKVSYDAKRKQTYQPIYYPNPTISHERKNNYLYDRTNSMYDRQIETQPENINNLTKLFSFQDKSKVPPAPQVSLSNNENRNVNSTHKKLKRTFHYVD